LYYGTNIRLHCFYSSECEWSFFVFLLGATLPDPNNLLEGSGNQNRFIRLNSAAMLARPEVDKLLRAAAVHAKSPLPTTGRGCTMIKSISDKQRPRR